MHGENGGDGHLLLLAARERGYLAFAQVGDAHGLERLGNALLDLVVGDAEVLKAKEHLVLDHRGHHLGVDVLQDAAHYLRDVGERHVAGVVSVDQRGAVEGTAVVVGDGARHHGGKGGLAGARGSNHAHELARANAQRHVAQRGVLAVLGASLDWCVVGERDVAHLDDGLFFPCGHKSLSCDRGTVPLSHTNAGVEARSVPATCVRQRDCPSVSRAVHYRSRTYFLRTFLRGK